MANYLELRWADRVSGAVVNVSGATLYEVRAKLEGTGSVWGRRTWMDEMRVLQPTEYIRFGRFNASSRGPENPPRLIVTFRTEIGGRVQFVELPLV